MKDSADNTLQLVLGVKKGSSLIGAAVVSLQYNGGPVIGTLQGALSVEWTASKSGSLKTLQQQVGVLTDSTPQVVLARFDGAKNVTVVSAGQPESSQPVSLPGMALIRLATAAGALVIEVPGL